MNQFSVNTVTGVLFLNILLNAAGGFLLGKILLWIDRKKLKENPVREQRFCVVVILIVLLWEIIESYVAHDFHDIGDSFVIAAGFILAVFLSTLPPQKKKPRKPRERVAFNHEKWRWVAVPGPV